MEAGRLSGDEFQSALSQHDMVITSFGIARRDIDMLETQEWSDLILDEAQNIKNSICQTDAGNPPTDRQFPFAD